MRRTLNCSIRNPHVWSTCPTRRTSPSLFHFNFKEHTESKPEGGNVEVHRWLGMRACKFDFSDNKIIQFEIRVDIVDDKLSVTHPGKSFNTRKVLESLWEDLTNEFIHLEKKIFPRGTVSEIGIAPVITPRPETLRLKISVTPIYLAFSTHRPPTSPKDSVIKAVIEREAYLSEDLKSMFTAEKNYADIKLEMKDGVMLTAHKFMLAARSPVIRDLIEEQVKEEEVNATATIKLDRINAKPMVAILHWMYTGELHEDAGNCMEELVDAATKFKLTALIKILDKKVITICKKENMFQLYQVAEKNRMKSAAADISKFIKDTL